MRAAVWLNLVEPGKNFGWPVVSNSENYGDQMIPDHATRKEFQALIRVTPDVGQVAIEERVDMKRRIRDVIQTPDGALLVIVDDAKGDLLRLTPTGSRPEQSVR